MTNTTNAPTDDELMIRFGDATNALYQRSLENYQRSQPADFQRLADRIIAGELMPQITIRFDATAASTWVILCDRKTGQPVKTLHTIESRLGTEH